MTPCTIRLTLIILHLANQLARAEQARLHALRELDAATRATLRARSHLLASEARS